MSLFPRLKAAWQILTTSASSISDLRNPAPWLLHWAGGTPSLAGVSTTPDTSLTLSSYFAAVRCISEDIGKIPLITYEQLTPRGKRRATEHWAYNLLLKAPNDLQTAMSWQESITSHALTWGNGYAEIIRDRGQIVGFSRPIHPTRVEIRFDENFELIYRVRSGDYTVPYDGGRPADTVDFNQRDMIHIRGLGEGLYGYSIAALAMQSLGLSLAAEYFGATFFGNGTNLGGYLKHPQSLSQAAKEHLAESWNTEYGGPTKSNKTAILEEGMEWQRIGIPPEEAQFLQTREFQVTEIARWFRMPPHKIAHLKDATFSNIEHQGIEYNTDTLHPWIVRWEQELERKLFGFNSAFFAQFRFQDLLRGDSVARSNMYRTRFYIGSMSPNDVREDEGENPIMLPDNTPDPAGDMYYIQNNLATLGSVAGTTEPIQTVERNGERFAMIPLHANGHTALQPWDDAQW